MTKDEAGERYTRVVSFIIRRYTINGHLITSTEYERSPYSKYELIAWNKYILGYRKEAVLTDTHSVCYNKHAERGELMRTKTSVELGFTAIDGGGSDIKTFKNIRYAKAFVEKRLGGCPKFDNEINQIVGCGWKVKIFHGATIADLIPNGKKEEKMTKESKSSSSADTVEKIKATSNMPQRISRILNFRHADNLTASAIADKEGVSTARINHLLITAERAAALALIAEKGLGKELKSLMIDFEVDAHDTVYMGLPVKVKVAKEKPAKAKKEKVAA